MTSLSELKAALKIDRFNLDQEIERQPTLYLEAAEMATSARSKLDLMKFNLDVLEAELDKELRLDPEVRSTEKAISMELQRHPQRVSAVEAYLQQKLRMEMREQLRDAFRQRSYVLRDMVALYVAGYFGDSTTSAKARGLESKAEMNKELMAEKRRLREKDG